MVNKWRSKISAIWGIIRANRFYVVHHSNDSKFYQRHCYNLTTITTEAIKVDIDNILDEHQGKKNLESVKQMLTLN